MTHEPPSVLTKSAPVIFATTFAGISKPWGNTVTTVGNVDQASIMLIAGDKDDTPWLLLKSQHIVIVQQLNVPADPVTLRPILGHAVARQGSVVHYERQNRTFLIHFRDEALFWSFLYHTTAHSNSSLFTTGMKTSTLARLWMTFNIPYDYPGSLSIAKSPEVSDVFHAPIRLAVDSLSVTVTGCILEAIPDVCEHEGIELFGGVWHVL
ncbi:hypothetical protein SERLA73DRAFT_182943 [Serpula lacrymans var. lacrymans S7.3]|uniref:Uncharacterized protein n=1 Tax=Serpula lacrymans var. lacrymans (strain S7.3) TaxID=936435 RepID=F8Q1A1_SERL3|nr:hypothetical protein SERLA73DRAFT_182943 [Serpula lacrymans var. lacrymans S7.3]